MSDIVKVAVILSVTCFICLAIFIFFSPYQGCVRSQSEKSPDFAADAGRLCAMLTTRTNYQ